MYFKNISDPELNQLPKPYAPNFSIKLSDILHKTNGAFDNKLFRIEEIVTGKLYRIYPMFNTKRIESTNPNDRIFENRLIICTKETSETFVTFISDENSEIQDYSNYATLYSIGDSLTTSQFNSIVQLIRANTNITEDIRISTDTVITDYANYDFSFDDGIILDNGIEVTNSTTLKCKLSNPVFHYSNYTLNIKALRITNTNSEDDDDTDNKTIIDISTVLTNKEFVDIDTSNLQVGDIILYDCIVNITHDKSVIQDWIHSIELSANPSIIQSGDTTDIYAECFDNGDVPVGSGHTVYFFEKLEPTITMSASADIIQTSDNVELYATVKDEDGSLAKGVKVYFYKED